MFSFTAHGRVFPLHLFVFASLSVLNAQVSGIVADSSGAPIPGASIELRSLNGAASLAAVTGTGGAFLIPQVAPGSYTLRASSSGFDATSLPLTVSAAPVTGLQLSLKVRGTSETIVVTGSRDQIEIAESPTAVNVVTRNDFAIRNVRLPDQTLAYSEGLNVSRTKGANDTGAGVGMRGFSARTQSRVLVLLDGQPLNDSYTGRVNWAALPISELERVEVARGPSSSLYGGNAMGGVIQMFTRPITHRTAELSAQYGTYQTMMYSARYSDRLWQRLGFTLSYQRMQSNGYSVDGVFGTATSVATATAPLVAAPQRWLTTTGGSRYQIGSQGENWYNQHSVRAKADYTISEKTTANFQFVQPRHQYGYDASRSSVLDSAGRPINTGSFFFNDNGLKRITISPTLFVAGPGGTGRNIFTGSLLHTFNAAHMLRISGGSAKSYSDWFALPAGSATFLGGPGTSTESPNRSDHAELQWNWSRSARQRYVLGTETRMDKAATLDYDLADFAILDSRTRLTKSSSGLAQTSALYAQGDFKLTQRLSLVAGGRFDYWRTYGGRTQAGPTNPLQAFPARSVNALTGKVAFSWDAGKGWILRAATGNAFRAPTLINLYRASAYPPGTITLPNSELEPERMISGEFGFRKQFGRRFDIDATYFENAVRNLIYTSTDLLTDPAGNTRRNFNAGRSHTRGAEIAFRQRAASWLRIAETYTLNDARITRNDFIPLSVGRYIPAVPRNVATVSLIGDCKGWTGSLSSRYMSRTFNSDTNTDYVKGVPGSWDPYYEIEASAGYRFKRYTSLFISGNNLTNRRYYQFYISPGRTISAGMTFHFEGAH